MRLGDVAGLTATTDPDPNGCPFLRVRIAVNPEITGQTAVSLKQALAEGDPMVVTRVYNPHEGCIYLNMTEMNEEEIGVACDKICEIVGVKPSA